MLILPAIKAIVLQIVVVIEKDDVSNEELDVVENNPEIINKGNLIQSAINFITEAVFKVEILIS